MTNPEAVAQQVELGNAVAGGRCLARIDGKVVLVSGGLPGETVTIRTTREEKKFSEAEVVEVLRPHPGRREAPCPHARECGGCDFQHAERDLQLSMKREIVVDAFRRIGRLDISSILEGPDADTSEFRWRNRARLTLDPAGQPGFVRRGTHDVVAIDSCLLLEERFENEVLPWLRFVPPWHRVGLRFDSRGETVFLFESADPPIERDRKRLGKLTRDMDRPESFRGALADRVPLWGERDLHFEVAGKDFRCDAASFFQVNPEGAEVLVRAAREMLGESNPGVLVDLYSGVGLFAVTLGSSFKSVIATEADRRATRHLKRNLKKNGIRGEARDEPAEVTARQGTWSPDVHTVVVDPPRAGLSKEVREGLAKRSPQRILSVSCDPATAARDVAFFVSSGWELTRLKAVDVFPVTAQIETMALLEKGPDTA